MKTIWKIVIAMALVVLLTMVIVKCSRAEGALSANVVGIDMGLVDVQGGMYYDVLSHRLYGGLEATVANWKNLLSLGAGGLTNGSKQAVLGSLRANVHTISQKLGWDYTLPVDVQLGLFGAANLQYEEESVAEDNPSQKWFWGVSLNIVKKF